MSQNLRLTVSERGFNDQGNEYIVYAKQPNEIYAYINYNYTEPNVYIRDGKDFIIQENVKEGDNITFEYDGIDYTIHPIPKAEGSDWHKATGDPPKINLKTQEKPDMISFTKLYKETRTLAQLLIDEGLSPSDRTSGEIEECIDTLKDKYLACLKIYEVYEDLASLGKDLNRLVALALATT